MMQAFGTKKLGQAAKGLKTSRSGFSTNVFIVVVTSQWEQKLDVRQGGGSSACLRPDTESVSSAMGGGSYPCPPVLSLDLSSTWYTGPIKWDWHLKPDHSALPFIRFLSSGTSRQAHRASCKAWQPSGCRHAGRHLDDGLALYASTASNVAERCVLYRAVTT